MLVCFEWRHAQTTHRQECLCPISIKRGSLLIGVPWAKGRILIQLESKKSPCGQGL